MGFRITSHSVYFSQTDPFNQKPANKHTHASRIMNNVDRIIHTARSRLWRFSFARKLKSRYRNGDAPVVPTQRYLSNRSVLFSRESVPDVPRDGRNPGACSPPFCPFLSGTYKNRQQWRRGLNFRRDDFRYGPVWGDKTDWLARLSALLKMGGIIRFRKEIFL